MLDKAKRGYAAKITGEITQVPTVGFRPAASHGAVTPLQMGWALKKARKKTVFRGAKEIPYWAICHWRGEWEKGRP